MAGIALLALLVRLSYVLGTWPRRLPFTDALYYQLQATTLAGGHGFLQPIVLQFEHRGVPTAAHPPLYPLFLTAGTLLGAKSVLAHEIMGCLVGVGTVVGVGLIADRVAGERAGMLAMVVAAVYPPLWVADGGIMSEGLFALVTTAVILTSYRLAERQSRRDAALLGLAVGLAMLTRAEAVLLFVVLVIPLIVAGRRIGARRSLGLLGVTVAVSGLVVSPWVVRNLVTFHHPVTLSTGDGTLLGANCPPAYYGPGVGTWYLSCYSQISLPPGADESDFNAAARHAGLQYLEHHLLRAPVVAGARVARIWQVYQPVQDANNDSDDGRPHWANLASLAGYAVVVPFAALGCVVLVRRRRTVLPLVAQLVGVTLTAAVVWGAVRLRIPADVVLVVFAGVAIDALLRPPLGARRDPVEDQDTTPGATRAAL